MPPYARSGHECVGVSSASVAENGSIPIVSYKYPYSDKQGYTPQDKTKPTKQINNIN